MKYLHAIIFCVLWLHGNSFKLGPRRAIGTVVSRKAISSFATASTTHSSNPERMRPSIFHWLPRRPMVKVFNKSFNIWGIIFGIQCWALMFVWFAYMIVFMPFKMLFPWLDRDGIVIDAGGRWWSRLVNFPHSIPRITGRENLPPKGEACIYIANHASWLDIPILGGYLPPFKFVCKKELTKVIHYPSCYCSLFCSFSWDCLKHALN